MITIGSRYRKYAVTDDDFNYEGFVDKALVGICHYTTSSPLIQRVDEQVLELSDRKPQRALGMSKT